MKSKLAILFLVLSMGLVFANPVSAEIVNCGRTSQLPPNPTAQDIKDNECTFGALIQTIVNIINLLLSWAWLVSILMIVISGFRLIFSAGNEEVVGQAKTSLSYAIGGFIVILLSFVIMNFVVEILTGGQLRAGNFIDAFNLKF